MSEELNILQQAFGPDLGRLIDGAYRLAARVITGNAYL